MISRDIVDVFSSIKKTLQDVEIQNEFFINLVATRLLIERIGESDNQAWWDSRVLSETGRNRLSEVTPKTRLKSQITLAIEVGQKAESESTPTDFVSLFSFGPQMESRLNTAIEGIEPDTEVRLNALEDLSVQSLDQDWTEPLVAELSTSVPATTEVEFAETPDATGSFLVDNGGRTQATVQEKKSAHLELLLQGYGHCTTQVSVPYYRLNSNTKSESA